MISKRSLTRLFAAISRPLSTTAAVETQTQKLERIADDLLSLNKLELQDYSILFRLKMGLNRFAPAVSAQPGPAAAAAGGAAAPAEKTAFDIKLEKFEASAKIKIIKEVRSFTDLGLKEAKDLVEKVPAVLKRGVAKDDATLIMNKLKELGATVVLE